MGWKDELARLRDTADNARQKVGELTDRAVAELREAEERAREHPSTLTGLAVEIRDSVQRAISEAADSVETALEPDEIGESMHREICEHFLVDDRLGAQRARGICDRLNGARAPARALVPVVVWGKFPTAVAAPGRYIYITRELQQRLRTDDAVAFVLAHEMAHHDLGHLELDPERLIRMDNPERETAADERALELCEAAGFDTTAALTTFDVLEAHALDHGALDHVFGEDLMPDDPLVQLQQWWRERRHGYPNLRDRKARLRRLVERKESS